MNPNNETYTRYALVREMLAAADVVAAFKESRVADLVDKLSYGKPADRKFLFAGEGSSRIFPAKNLIACAMRAGYPFRLVTENATQALDYDLNEYTVFVASNSGKTKECVRLIRKLKPSTSVRLVAVTAHGASPVAEEADLAYVLDCGEEAAVAATVSVVEQALVYDLLFRRMAGRDTLDLAEPASSLRTAMTMAVPEDIVRRIASGGTIYFAGPNNGVAEELTLKTNEICRRKSDFLEGTYAVHGIEEVLEPEDTVIVVDPYPDEEAKFHQVLVEGVGLEVYSIAHRESRFPGLLLPDLGDMNPYLELAAGWNLLVEIGLALSIDLDKPERARKVGNEFPG